MFSYKRLVYIGIFVLLLSFTALLVSMTGMSNLEGPFGVPTVSEVKFLESLKQKPEIIVTASNTDAEPSFMKYTKEEDMQGRIHRVEILCQKYHLGKYTLPNGTNDVGVKDPPTPLYSYFFLNKEKKLAWCPVYKAGSTTWLYNMMILKGYSEEFLANPPKQLSILADEIYEDAEPGMEFNKAVKLLVVRHPFERIVSAYKDKLANSTGGLEHGTEYYYEKYGKKIVNKFRSIPHNEQNNVKILQKEPTFEEFVRYLIKTDLILYADDHWLPAYSSCTPCLVQYDFIAKVETYLDDQKFIIEKVGLSHIIRPRWQHRSSSSVMHNSSSNFRSDKRNDSYPSSTAIHYFSQLTRSQIMDLYRKYFLDFEMFGYSHEKYLKIGKKRDDS